MGLYFINAAQLQTQTRVSHRFDRNDTIEETTVGLPPGAGGSIRGQKVAYTLREAIRGNRVSYSTWVADVSATPNPRRVAATGARTIGFRPDDAALLYSRSGQVMEAALDGSVSDQFVGPGESGWYDSTGNIVLLRQSLPSGGSPSAYPALASTVRGSFGTAVALGSPALAAQFREVSGFDRAVVLGEGPATGEPPGTVRVALVNAMAPDKLLYLADFSSPLQLASSPAVVVR